MVDSEVEWQANPHRRIRVSFPHARGEWLQSLYGRSIYRLMAGRACRSIRQANRASQPLLTVKHIEKTGILQSTRLSHYQGQRLPCVKVPVSIRQESVI